MACLRRLWPFAVALAPLACSTPEAAIAPVSEAALAAPPPRLGETAQFDAALRRAEPDALRLEAEAAALAARAAALRARAAGLSGPVVDPAALPRLEAGGP